MLTDKEMIICVTKKHVDANLLKENAIVKTLKETVVKLNL